MLDKNYIYESTFTNEVFFISEVSEDFEFSISAKSDNFEILALCSAKQKVQNDLETKLLDQSGCKFFWYVWGHIDSPGWHELSYPITLVKKWPP